MPTILITGANSGIGLTLAKLYQSSGWTVIGTCRNLDRADMPGERLFLEISQESSIAQLAHSIGDRPLDILWNNAGVYFDKSESLDRGILDENIPLSEMDWGKWTETFEINTIGPIRLCNALVQNVAVSDHKIMAFTSSRMASISQNTGGSFAYRSSKSALNMAVDCLTKEYHRYGIKTALLSPGWVKTQMGGPEAAIDAETSALGMKEQLDVLTAADSGRFVSYEGEQMPW